MENSTFLAGEQKTAADILLFHGSVHESISETLYCGSTTDFECMFQNSWCCVKTGLPREREVYSLEQVNHEKNCDFTILSRKIYFLSLQVVQIFTAGSQAEKRKKYCGLQQNEALLTSIAIFFSRK